MLLLTRRGLARRQSIRTIIRLFRSSRLREVRREDVEERAILRVAGPVAVQTVQCTVVSVLLALVCNYFKLA